MKKYWLKTFHLSWELAKANFKLRNEGSYLGVIWYLLDPLLMFLVLYFVFSKNIGSGIEFYSIYLLAGLIVFNFFSSVTNESTSIINSNGGFIKSINIPAESLVFSLLLRHLFSHFFEIIVFITFLLYFKVSIIGILFYLPILFIFFLFTAGLSFILATLGVYTNDLNNIWRFISQVLFFASSIFYKFDSSLLILKFNPIASFIELSRQALIYQKWPVLSWSLIFVTLSTFLFGLLIFIRNKHKFAEKI